MISCHIGVTTVTNQVHPDELAAAARALQIQVMRDFYPEWGVNAIVSSGSFNALPAGTIPIIVQDDLSGPYADGFHRVQRDEAPYIVIPYGPNWPLAASHELLRMLANPSGSARVAGASRLTGQGTVEYLVDVCGPCQGVGGSYAIDGVAVSDFCRRGFYAMGGVAGSFAGGGRTAFEPGAEGVVTWLADDGLLYQARGDATGRVRVHGGFSPGNRGGMMLGEWVDRLTPDRLVELSNSPRSSRLMEAAANARRAHFANMSRFEEDIAWRFGAAREPVAVVEPVQAGRRLNSDGFVPTVPASGRVAADAVRSPS